MDKLQAGDQVRIRDKSVHLFPLIEKNEKLEIMLVGIGSLKSFYQVKSKKEKFLIAGAHLEKVER